MSTVICWFRQDLRLEDNPALVSAAKAGEVLPIYILDDDAAGEWRMGGASRWWLHHSLVKLSESLEGNLAVFRGRAEDIIRDLVQKYDVKAVFWNRCYEPWRMTRDASIKSELNDNGIEAESFNGSLLWEPWQVTKQDGTPYRVFTPFYKNGCLQQPPPRGVVAKPSSLRYAKCKGLTTEVESLSLLPSHNWPDQLVPHWQMGEGAAKSCLQTFIEESLQMYTEGRDYPAKQATSSLSPYLHNGELSPNKVWWAVRQQTDGKAAEMFLRQLVWREFSYSLLYFNPELPKKSLQEKFENFPWQHDEERLAAWQQGMTGYPIIDAGMRQLWQTGYMHNRIRMLVGSFLVKNLLLHWHYGEKWFWDCLVDADLANNSASWQWVAGCGADAAPYFRIFNPVLQGEKFDKSGEYVRCYVPELAKLPDKYLHNPSGAPSEVLYAAGVVLGKTYPTPVVDLAESRARALTALQSIKTQIVT